MNAWAASPVRSPSVIGGGHRETRSALADLRQALGWLMRAGHVSRGLVFAVPGVLAMRLATGDHGAAISQPRAIEFIAHRPYGLLALGLVAIGLSGYVLWGLVRAVLDARNKGWSLGGVLIRLGYLTSAIGYGSLLAFSIGLLAGTHSGGSAQQDWAPAVLSHPFGAWLVGIIALCWIIGGGVVQLVSAARAGFRRDLDLDRMGIAERRWAITLGRIGIAARGIVFLTIGFTLIGVAIHADASEPHDLAGALLELMRQPFGHPLLFVVAIGLIVFGVYSMCCARWARVRFARGRKYPAGFSPHPHEVHHA